MILSFGQLLQPATAREIYAFATGTIVGKSLNEDQFRKRFKKLEREGFFWRTANNKFVITPNGERLARGNLDPKKRDKLRLLILNKQRYNS